MKKLRQNNGASGQETPHLNAGRNYDYRLRLLCLLHPRTSFAWDVFNKENTVSILSLNLGNLCVARERMRTPDEILSEFTRRFTATNDDDKTELSMYHRSLMMNQIKKGLHDILYSLDEFATGKATNCLNPGCSCCGGWKYAVESLHIELDRTTYGN